MNDNSKINIPVQTAKSAIPKNDEYINTSDGLIYCKKCNTPRQKRVSVLGKTYMPDIMCQCEREVYEKEESERIRREFLNDIAVKRSAGLHDRALYECTFDKDMGYNSQQSEKARGYALHFPKMLEKGIGLLLWGDIGTGKTFLAGCIANALLNQCIPVMMTTFGRILNTLTGMFQEDRNSYIDSLNQYSLLIIDDLGMERSTEFALEQVFNVIDTRYRSKKPLIVTTNLTLDELKNPCDLARSRIYDRILEVCVPLKISSQNIRTINSEANFKEARNILSHPKNDTNVTRD
ncbi:MAG: ATP-binding protein [Lachnospiraceae bacterium]|nr:ATP-binding protein [Lachnospiraceae bacterium]